MLSRLEAGWSDNISEHWGTGAKVQPVNESYVTQLEWRMESTASSGASVWRRYFGGRGPAQGSSAGRCQLQRALSRDDGTDGEYGPV